MPTSEQHTQHAGHNIDFFKSFVNIYEYNDWAKTVAFYIALHVIENAIYEKQNLSYRGQAISIRHSDDLPSEAAKRKIDPPKNLLGASNNYHQFRNILVKENFVDIAEFYMLLYRESKTARYKYYKFTDNNVKLTAMFPLITIIKWSNDNCSTKFNSDLETK